MNKRESGRNHSSKKTMKGMKPALKDVELRIVVELMKNSRRSDREIAKVVGVSQPTISRTIAKLEREGIIKEYTMIPDFVKLGYQIMSSTRFEVHKESFEIEFKASEAIAKAYGGLTAVEGVSEKRNRMFVNLYRNYSEYIQATNFLRAIPNIDADDFDTFLVDLNRPGYRILSMSAIANQLLKRLDKEGVKP